MNTIDVLTIFTSVIVLLVISSINIVAQTTSKIEVPDIPVEKLKHMKPEVDRPTQSHPNKCAMYWGATDPMGHYVGLTIMNLNFKNGKCLVSPSATPNEKSVVGYSNTPESPPLYTITRLGDYGFLIAGLDANGRASKCGYTKDRQNPEYFRSKNIPICSYETIQTGEAFFNKMRKAFVE